MIERLFSSIQEDLTVDDAVIVFQLACVLDTFIIGSSPLEGDAIKSDLRTMQCNTINGSFTTVYRLYSS